MKLTDELKEIGGIVLYSLTKKTDCSLCGTISADLKCFDEDDGRIYICSECVKLRYLNDNEKPRI